MLQANGLTSTDLASKSPLEQETQASTSSSPKAEKRKRTEESSNINNQSDDDDIVDVTLEEEERRLVVRCIIAFSLPIVIKSDIFVGAT